MNPISEYARNSGNDLNFRVPQPYYIVIAPYFQRIWLPNPAYGLRIQKLSRSHLASEIDYIYSLLYSHGKASKMAFAPKKDGGPNLKFYESAETTQLFEVVKTWLIKNCKKVSAARTLTFLICEPF